jgi:hypothetical protein
MKFSYTHNGESMNGTVDAADFVGNDIVNGMPEEKSPWYKFRGWRKSGIGQGDEERKIEEIVALGLRKIDELNTLSASVSEIDNVIAQFIANKPILSQVKLQEEAKSHGRRLTGKEDAIKAIERHFEGLKEAAEVYLVALEQKRIAANQFLSHVQAITTDFKSRKGPYVNGSRWDVLMQRETFLLEQLELLKPTDSTHEFKKTYVHYKKELDDAEQKIVLNLVESKFGAIRPLLNHIDRQADKLITETDHRSFSTLIEQLKDVIKLYVEKRELISTDKENASLFAEYAENVRRNSAQLIKDVSRNRQESLTELQSVFKLGGSWLQFWLMAIIFFVLVFAEYQLVGHTITKVFNIVFSESQSRVSTWITKATGISFIIGYNLALGMCIKFMLSTYSMTINTRGVRQPLFIVPAVLFSIAITGVVFISNASVGQLAVVSDVVKDNPRSTQVFLTTFTMLLSGVAGIVFHWGITLFEPLWYRRQIGNQVEGELKQLKDERDKIENQFKQLVNVQSTLSSACAAANHSSLVNVDKFMDKAKEVSIHHYNLGFSLGLAEVRDTVAPKKLAEMFRMKKLIKKFTT